VKNSFNFVFQIITCPKLRKLTGGYSVIIHGYNRTTGDMDLLVNPTTSNFKKVVEAFKQFGMPLFGMTLEKFLDSDNFDVFEYGRPPVSIDIITKIKGVNFKDSFENAIRYNISDDLSINVIHFNRLIEAKEASGRPKDINDIRHLKGE